MTIPTEVEIPIREALAETGLPLSLRTVTRLVAAGQVPGAHRIGARRWYVSAENLRRALVKEASSVTP